MHSALGLTCNNRKLALEKQPTAHLSHLKCGPSSRTSARGSHAQGNCHRRTDCKPWPKFSWLICRQTSKRGLFRPLIELYLASPNFPPCPTCTSGCSAAAPTRCVRSGRCPRRVRRESSIIRAQLRGLLDFGKVLLSYLIIKV